MKNVRHLVKRCQGAALAGMIVVMTGLPTGTAWAIGPGESGVTSAVTSGGPGGPGVAGGGSGVGVQQVGEGLVQIGNTGRPLKDKEIEKFGLKTFPFAIDGVALVVNPANNVSDITAQQAADIYNGKITNWKELGGTDAPITLYTREDGSGTREVFVERALNKGSIVQSANVVNSNGAMKTAVAQDKQSIGYVGIGHVDKNVKALVFDKMVPSQENASNGTYKVTRLLFMNTNGAPEDITKAFIDYIYTPEGTEIIKKSGYIPTGRQ